ncbi:MAG: DUF1565 domain-containing protein, partial [Anaerolineae bacterium]|nr:DUF1565 domain-containing protein [Anaerolineae bacterium]
MISPSFAQSPQCTDVCYVDAAAGNDSNGGSTPDQAKQTIQAAIDAVQPGGEIVVAAGEYVEQLFIDKNVSLHGEDANDVIISAPDTLRNSLPVPSGATTVRSIVTVRGGAITSLRSLTIAGPVSASRCEDNVSGIYVHQDAQLVLSDAVVRDVYPSGEGED